MHCLTPPPQSFAPASNKINLQLNIFCKDIRVVYKLCILNSVLQQRERGELELVFQEADRQQQVLPCPAGSFLVLPCCSPGTIEERGERSPGPDLVTILQSPPRPVTVPSLLASVPAYRALAEPVINQFTNVRQCEAVRL